MDEKCVPLAQRLRSGALECISEMTVLLLSAVMAHFHKDELDTDQTREYGEEAGLADCLFVDLRRDDRKLNSLKFGSPGRFPGDKSVGRQKVSRLSTYVEPHTVTRKRT